LLLFEELVFSASSADEGVWLVVAAGFRGCGSDKSGISWSAM